MSERPNGHGPRVAVIDHGAGNLVSIRQGLAAVGAHPVLARRPPDLLGAAAVVLPGVGAAGPAMARLRRRDLLAPLVDWLAADRPFLGICLGLQLLVDGSDEDGSAGLGVLPGRAVLLRGAPRVPHIGWNEVRLRRPHPAFARLPSPVHQYFVHSYAVEPAPGSEQLVLAETRHGRPFASAVARGRLLGVQFHPERSARDGLALLAGFVGMAATRSEDAPAATAQRPGVSARC